MARQIFIGLMREGSTDQTFLKSIIERTFDEIRFDCNTELDIFDVEEIIPEGDTFCEKLLNASKEGIDKFGMTILCVHADADSRTINDTVENKITPALDLVNNSTEDICKIIVPIIPIQETESWMLADKALFKKELGTEKTDNELGINKDPETIANPKEIIQSAIRISREGMTKRRRGDLTIKDLYLPIGQSIDLSELKKLMSYNHFSEQIRNAFISLHLI